LRELETREARISARPLEEPLAEGVNVTVKVALAPAARLKGRVTPPIVNADPVATAEVMLHVFWPLLVTATVRARLLPTATLPKFRVEELVSSGPWPKPRVENAIKKKTNRVNRLAFECEGWLFTVRPPLRGA
jgi:hypothetical protein